MGASSYKKNLITSFTLGDGTKIQIKRLKPKDFVESGAIPDVLYDFTMPEAKKRETLSDKKTLEALYKAAFLKAVIPQKDFIPVDKPEAELAEDEICVDLLSEIEKAMILAKAVQGGFGEEPKPFQDGEQKP